MDNKETIFDELTNFEKGKLKEITPLLDEYLAKIAKTGDTIFPWVKLKPLIKTKMEVVMVEFNETCPLDDYTPCPNVDRFTYDLMKEKLLEAVDKFSNSPFTIQRICELLTAPLQHYKRVDKFMRGLEKNVLVVSTVEPGCSHIFACDCARKRAEHNNSITVNGLTDSRTPLNGEETYITPFAESEKISFPSPEVDDQNNHAVAPQQAGANNADSLESKELLESGDKEAAMDVPDPSVISAIETSEHAESQQLESKDEGSPTQSGDIKDATEPEERNGGYSSDDTVSSSTHCPVSVESVANEVTPDVVSESQKRPDEEDADFNQVSGNNTFVADAAIVETDKTEEEIDSSSQDGETSICIEKDSASPQPAAIDQSTDEVNEPPEASSSEEDSPVDESTSSTTCIFQTDEIHPGATDEASLIKVEQEQPSSSNMEPDDAARMNIQENTVDVQFSATTMQPSPPQECEPADDEAMDVVSVDTVASEMSEGHFSSISKISLSFELQPESSSPLSSLPSSPPALSPNDLDCTSFSTAASSSSSLQILPHDEVSTFSESSLAGRSPESLSCTDVPEPMDED